MNADPIEVAMLANMVRSNGHQLGPLIIGVDPGISGALVLLDPATMRVWKWADTEAFFVWVHNLSRNLWYTDDGVNCVHNLETS